MDQEQIASALGRLKALEQPNPGDLNALQQHLVEMQIRVSDINVRIEQLREQQVQLSGDARARLDKPIADLQHDRIAAAVDLQVTEGRMAAMQAGMTEQPPHDVLFNESMVEKVGSGLFLLMIPIVFALARRIWVRSGPRVQPVVDLESSPRLQRLEEAIESIAIEVERIGEAQRFATKLLVERPEPVVNRAVPAQTPIARKAPGTITPH
jgi:hypothetical protein